VQLANRAAIWTELERLCDERSGYSIRMVDDDNRLAVNASSVLPFNFEAGLVGYIGYAMRSSCTPETLRPLHFEFEPAPAEPASSSSSSSVAGESGVAKAAMASLPPLQPFRVPDLAFMFADRLLVFDHAERHVYALCLCEEADDPSAIPAAAASVANGRAWIERTEKRLAELVASSSSAAAAAASAPSSSSGAAASPPAAALASLSSSSSSSAAGVSMLSPSVSLRTEWFQSEPVYLHAIEQCLRAIRAGESYEICLTNQLDITVDVCRPAAATAAAATPAQAQLAQKRNASIRPLDYYRVLRRVNPAAYAAFFRFRFADFSSGLPGCESGPPSDAASCPAWHICCSSPERFLCVNRGGLAESKPIKGTAARGATEAEDEAAKQALASSTKDFAENLMIVDLLRHDLGRVCAWASVRVPKLMEVESYATVHNLVSTVVGQLRPDQGPFDLLKAAFPPGSMTGAPKLRTCQILAQLECEDDEANVAVATKAVEERGNAKEEEHPIPRRRGRERGIYSGCIGYVGLNGCADLNVVIRTAIVQERVRTEPASTSAASLSAPSAGASSSSASASQNQQLVYSTLFRIGAGGAIVNLSDAAAEYDEVHLKTKALVNAVRLAAQALDL
jgi:para-aminobenzoate synthetase